MWSHFLEAPESLHFNTDFFNSIAMVSILIKYVMLVVVRIMAPKDAQVLVLQLCYLT